MELVRIIVQETSEQAIIYLREADGERTFPIVIGVYEAMAIDRRIKGIQAPRPLTHDLLNAMIPSLGGKLERIVISDLRKGTFYARIVIDQDGREVIVDARPSDAVAMAVLDNTPIYVEESVLEEAAQDQA